MCDDAVEERQDGTVMSKVEEERAESSCRVPGGGRVGLYLFM